MRPGIDTIEEGLRGCRHKTGSPQGAARIFSNEGRFTAGPYFLRLRQTGLTPHAQPIAKLFIQHAYEAAKALATRK